VSSRALTMTEVIRAYESGVPVIERLYGAIESSIPRRRYARSSPSPRVLLLSFPNSGTTVTTKLGECLARRPMCTSYCRQELWHRRTNGFECDAIPSIACGPGAAMYRSWRESDQRTSPAGTLIKSHGIGYAAFPTPYGFFAYGEGTTARGLSEYVNRTFGGCSGKGGGLDSILQLQRNPFDNLVARYHFKVHANKNYTSRWTGSWRHPSGISLVRVRDFLDDPTIAGSGTPRDLCVMLQWYHRTAWLRREGCAVQTLPYELMYADPARYSVAVAEALRAHPNATQQQACLRLVMARSEWNASSFSPAMVPNYLDQFDLPTARRVLTGIERYLNLSKDFSSPSLVKCDHHPRWWPPLEAWAARRSRK
jgi:hypothetical protein